MKNKKTFVVKIDWDKQEVLHEDLNAIVCDCIEKNIDFELLLIDAKDLLIDSDINTIVNQYIADGKKVNAPIAVKYEYTCEFIENLMKYIVKKESHTDVHDPDKIQIDFIAPNGRSFCVDIPEKILSERTKENLMYLGPDYVGGCFLLPHLFQHVISAFYLFLYENDLFNDAKNSDLFNYKFGLH